MAHDNSEPEPAHQRVSAAVRKLRLQLRKVMLWNRELNAQLQERLGEVEALVAEMAPTVLGKPQPSRKRVRKSPLDNTRPDAPENNDASDANIIIDENIVNHARK